ncbi:cyclin-dependent kinase-like 1 [Athalia rosae]|uniref:cyclin-dependent kinase-like 1 n=1 Tax=Athalia rosae TaxID=37344 RepID=UPI002033CBFE|nr:cyclin-dependent kinase-like 1 [Athalia rosae]XP_048510361.1 cyclin-dependent kinase-like 1 [Athalia rosae]XP_048510362.1 cyclin-dependent kinase-like 1 [Athalia rosae]XP_048510363.1 cyclin-dependent kinase-like 1 [Athalia rosae]
MSNCKSNILTRITSGMEKYESLEVVGEGSYGVVMKCRHRDTGQIVAIKKFLETEEDVHVRKMALREIRMLKKLRHENLVNMIEVFRRRKRFYLVFEYLDHTLLDELEAVGTGLGVDVSRRHIFQVLRGLNYCHMNHIMHRDVKPENVLVSPNGIVKLCDFGFARMLSGPNESCTDYVATRWYRAPELLVGDSRYGKGVDVWAVGCLYAEAISGDPLFPGDSDIDQLYQIMKLLGNLCPKHQTIMARSNNMRGIKRVTTDIGMIGSIRSLRSVFPSWPTTTIDFLAQCLRMDPETRSSCTTLLDHPLFTQDHFSERFLSELQHIIAKEMMESPFTQQRLESRRLSAMLPERPARICYSSNGRWQMTLIRGGGTCNAMCQPEMEQARESVASIERPPLLTINRTKEPCHFGPVSVIPNTTYIRRLENRGILVPKTKGCSLPALASRESSHAKENTKRKRVDLPHVDR